MRRSKGGQRGFTIKYARHENVPAGQRSALKRVANPNRRQRRATAKRIKREAQS